MDDERLDEMAELKADYAALGAKIAVAEGSAAAALVRERRLLRSRMLHVEESDGGTVLDEVAAKRESKAAVARPPARRRQSR